MFHLVRNTTIVIGWLMTPGHTWFGKHELGQIKHLISDFGHPHIFTAILASTGQFKIYPFQLVVIFIELILVNLIHLNMCNLIAWVFQRIIRILISLSLTF
jgi:hypothetical protein